jgi:hypothetical protein
MATEKELLTARIFLRAALPVIKVMLEDDPKKREKFQGVNATVQFVAKDPAGPVGAYLKFSDGAFAVVHEIAENPDITFSFASVAKMNAMFAGKPVLPSPGPLLAALVSKPGLLINVFGILLGLKILMPNATPKTDALKRMKVKMTLYMVSTALSQLNKAGEPDMAKWTLKQPERIYQWSVDGEPIACYLRVKAGKTQAGRGMYARRKPFVHMRFSSVDNALPVLSNSVDTVQAISQGLIVSDGSPEYGGKLGDFMQRIAALVA